MILAGFDIEADGAQGASPQLNGIAAELGIDHDLVVSLDDAHVSPQRAAVLKADPIFGRQRRGGGEQAEEERQRREEADRKRIRNAVPSTLCIVDSGRSVKL